MKLTKIILVLSISFICFTCNETSEKKQIVKDSQSLSEKIKGHSKISSNTQTSLITDSIAALPFGSKILTTYEFPKTWQTAEDTDGNPVLNKNDINLNRLVDYYAKLGRVKSIKRPGIKSKVFIKLGDDSIIVKDQRDLKNDFRYKFPNINKYELYYICDHYDYDPKNYNPLIASKDHEIYEEIGSLVFYDPKTKTANMLNTYYFYGYPEIEGFGCRFFHIDDDKTIKIFESNGDENGTNFNVTQIIKVLADGKIDVKNLN